MRKSYIKPPAISTRHRDFPPRPPVRSVHFRSYGCQVKPKDIPNLYKFGISETESQYTGVHYRGDYALLREQIPIPQILPHEELAPIERSASWTSSRRFDSVEMKVAEALADKEGCAAKRKLAIEQEAERKRLKLMGKQNMEKGIAVTTDSPQLPSLDGPFEEKYVGPLLNGAVPEMIVSSGSLGMTDTKPKQQIIRQRKRPSEQLDDPDWVFDDPSQPSTSSSHEKKMKSMNTTSQLNEEPHDYTPNPEAHWESFGSSIPSLKDLHRYREIGRIISEITLADFPSDKDRKVGHIASRGEEILAAVKRNLNVIREKLGEYAEGTIFDYVDELTESFAQATPQSVDRLSQMVAEKLQRNKVGEDPQPFHLAPAGSTMDKEVKLEEVEVKLEEPEYTDNCNF